MKKSLIVAALLAGLLGSTSQGWARGSSYSRRTEHVSGYVNKYGHYVKPYYRAPAGTSDALESSPSYGSSQSTNYQTSESGARPPAMGSNLESKDGILAEQRKGYSLNDIGTERDRRAAGQTTAQNNAAQNGQDFSATSSPVSSSFDDSTSNSTVSDNSVSDSSTLARTGGNPLLMVLSGLSIAASALFLRRKLA